ncbi:MAG: sugar transferase [Chloroflexota bacterium]
MAENINPVISIIIPAYNAAKTLAACLHALETQEGIGRNEYEVIVVDDCSTDETAVLCQQQAVHLVRHTVRKGAGAARNSGLQIARGSLICFTDADCVPAPDWLRHMRQPFQDPFIAGCKGIYATHQKELLARFVQIEYEDKYDLLQTQPFIDFIDTYSGGYRRQILLENNGFDEHFHFTEDQELSFRLAARGYQFVFQPQAVVSHRHSSTLGKYVWKKFWIGYWKLQTIRRFPERAVQDSHTPQVMKWQMALAGGILLITAVLPPSLLLFPQFSSWLALLWALLIVFFGVTTLPFTRKAWQKDKQVALAAPFLLGVRALALGLGTFWGLLHPEQGELVETQGITGLPYLLKRTLDIVGSVCGLGVTAVLFPFLALAIKLDSPGPVIFKQQRIGREGKPFTLYKFRSMRQDAEDELDGLVNWETLEEPVFKMVNDPRLTRVGRFCRRWSLDELPQFWNTLKGDMSLVGPRPESPQFVARYSAWHRRRLMVKPGLTGPMQVNGRGALSLDGRVRLELDYIAHYSLWRDLTILAKTIPVVLRGKGAW